MPRNLDLTALRSFAAVADAGGVTRAASQLNLTQSAVSMQLKRLEESLGLSLLDRSARTIALTAQGEQLLAYARRLLALNDEAWGRLTHPAFEGAIDFGVPHDIIYPHVPRVLQRFAAEYPRVKLQAAFALHQRAEGALRPRRDGPDPDDRGEGRPGGETLACEPLVWTGAQGGQAWRGAPAALRLLRPLRLQAAGPRGARGGGHHRGSSWSSSISPAAVEASVAADLAVSVQMASAVPAAFRGDPPRRRAAGAARRTASTCTSAPARAPVAGASRR